MFLLILGTLVSSLRGSSADTGASVWGRTHCQGSFCITLSEGDITAEAGLCVVIPCSFTINYYGFTAQHMVWYKCKKSDRKCGDSDIIFHTNNNNKVQSGFRGRVSLLEPDMSQRICSIIVNDLTESDSGSYQLRVNGLLNSRTSGFTFPTRATVSVKALTQKPTVVVPPLTEGQQTTLTCTAPGLCSGSAPIITWTWSGAGENDSHITGNLTDFKTEDLTAVTQRHSSTLTLNPSAEHHGTNITCKVEFTNDITTEETVTLNVTYVKEVKITGNIRVKEGDRLNLTCSVDSFPPALISWTKFPDENMQNGTEMILQNDTLADLKNDTETFPKEESGISTFSISDVTAKDSGLYVCTAKHLIDTLMERVDVAVMYVRKPVITGDTAVKEGDSLNLTCSVESFPPAHITWTVLGSNTNLYDGPDADLQNNTGSAALILPNMTVQHAGRYICTAKHLDRTVSACAEVTVTWFSNIFKSSGCEVQSGVLTCMCAAEGLPLPTIKWPLLKNHTDYFVTTKVTNHTVNSTVTLTINDHGNTPVECISSHQNGEAKKNLTIQINTSIQKDPSTSKEVLKIVSRLEVIIAFFIGILISAVLCCLAIKCHRKKFSHSGNLNTTLEMVTSQDEPLISVGEEVEDDQTYYQDAVEEEGAAAAEQAAPDLDGGPKDVEYASIDFSVLKRRPREAAEKQETTETEYAEIKKQVKEERDDTVGEEAEVDREEEEEEEEAMIWQDEETQQCIPEEEEGEDMAVYSNVKDIMGEI